MSPDTEAIDKEPKTIALELAALSKVEEGTKLAGEGKVQEAIALYQEAQKLAPEIDLNPDTDVIDKDPEAVARSWAALAKVEEGQRRAEEGKVQEAIAIFKQAQQLDPEIDLNPETETPDKDPQAVAEKLAAEGKVKEGERLAK